MSNCATCQDLIRRRATATLADHLEKIHRIWRGTQRKAEEMVFGTRGDKE